MKQRVPHLLILFCSLIGVLSVAVVDMSRTAPGKITRVHGVESDLDKGQNCAACHGGIFESMGDACLECHSVIEEHLEKDIGLHGRLAAVEADRCSTCHSEHHGEEFAMVNLQSFVQAGIADPAKFDHNMVDFDMQGKHLELDCTECHTFANHEIVPEGARRYIGLSSDCASCHEDPHEGAMRQGCSNCHSQTGFEVQHLDRHEEFFPLVGSHGQAACIDCHDPEGPRSIAAQMSGEADEEERTCIACHESPHRERFLLGNALAVDEAKGASCSACHDPTHEEFRGDAGELTAEEHALSGFDLGEPHGDVACDDCHDPRAKKFRARFPGRKRDDCASCHESPHGEQFVGDPFSNNKCTSCHDLTAFEPHAFTADKHAQAAIELSGVHGTLDCDSCHEPVEANETRIFRGTPNRCEQCHDDAHDQFFAPRQKKRGTPKEGECGVCHTTETFTDVPESRFRHGNWTGFRLQGAHAQNRCESCHERSPEPDESGRTFGRIADHFGEVKDCATCHGDPHEGQFDQGDSPTEVDGRAGCLRCHGESSFRALPFGFGHVRWTGFALTGAHKEADCAACHTPIRGQASAELAGRTWERAPGNQCFNCHADPHASQFAEDGAIDCARCHKATKSFADLRFRHDLDSRFPLDTQHESLECSACHKSYSLEDRKVVRYRPLGIACADCHGVNEDVLRKSRRNR